jgi:hypothetical protein
LYRGRRDSFHRQAGWIGKDFIVHYEVENTGFQPVSFSICVLMTLVVLRNIHRQVLLKPARILTDFQSSAPGA